MKWLAVAGNFFFPGLGYLIAVPHKRAHGVLWLIAAIGFTYVEQVALGPDHAAFWPMFASVFVLNTAFANDAYQEVGLLEARVTP
ncbi:MAG: hypothetical protein H6737_08600 [Alphaproteobacteria bacterium]|nr:hypothetical protein [Alphaproteobacteria bacterium]